MASWLKRLKNIYHPYRIFTVLVLFFLTGAFVASFLDLNFTSVWPVVLITIFALLLLSLIYFNKSLKIIVLIIFAIISSYLGILYYSFYEQRVKVDLTFGQTMEFEAVITSRPQVDFDKQKFIATYPLEGGKKAHILVTAAHFPNYKYGQMIELSGQIAEPQNFGDFDYKSYLKRYHVFGLMNKPMITDMGKSKNIFDRSMALLYDFSSLLEETINKVLPEPHASLSAGILLGVKRNIPDKLMDQLNAVGLTHIIALSGYNVTIIIAILETFLIGYFSRRQTFCIGSAFVIFFVLMTGASSSVVRAAVFSLLLLFGATLGRKADKTNLMLLAALLMVIANPYVSRFDTGFQLSFLAFAGIIYLVEPIGILFKKIKKLKLPDYIRKPLTETLGAQLMVFPLIWFQFGRLSIIAPLANIIVLPFLPLSMAFISLVSLLGAIYLPLGQAIALLLWPILTFIIKVVEILSRVPLSSIAK